jgi:hypothetical protein
MEVIWLSQGNYGDFERMLAFLEFMSGAIASMHEHRRTTHHYRGQRQKVIKWSDIASQWPWRAAGIVGSSNIVDRFSEVLNSELYPEVKSNLVLPEGLVTYVPCEAIIVQFPFTITRSTAAE